MSQFPSEKERRFAAEVINKTALFLQPGDARLRLVLLPKWGEEPTTEVIASEQEILENEAAALAKVKELLKSRRPALAVALFPLHDAFIVKGAAGSKVLPELIGKPKALLHALDLATEATSLLMALITNGRELDHVGLQFQISELGPNNVDNRIFLLSNEPLQGAEEAFSEKLIKVMKWRLEP